MNRVESFVKMAGGRLLWANALLLITLKVIVPYAGSGLATISEPLSPVDTADTIVVDTNAVRVADDLPALNRSPLLDAAAAQKLEDMATKGYFEHVSPNGVQPWDWIRAQGYAYRAAGENLAKGFTDPSTAVTAWMNSPSHRANIVNTRYQDIGVAAKYITIGGATTMVIVQMFGSPLPPVVPVPVVTTVPAVHPHAAVPAPAAQAVSTDQKIPPVHAAITVPAVSRTADISRSLSSMMAMYLSGLMMILLACGVMIGVRRPLGWALMANAALLILITVLPTVASGTHLIF